MKKPWKSTTLGTIAESQGGLVDGPFGSNLPASSYTESGVPVIRGSNLSLGGTHFKGDNFVFVSEETAKRLVRSLCLPDDIVFTKKGTLGQTGIVPDGGHDKFLLSSNQMRLRIDSQKALPLFVYYFVSSPMSRAKVIQDASITGVPKTNLAYLKDFPITLPTLAEQRAIANILGTLDDKIELNRRMNGTLEGMARAVFQSWFVDFDPVLDNALAAGNPIPEELQEKAARRPSPKGKRKSVKQGEALSPIHALFPDAFEESELGWIPKGWETTTLLEMVELIGGGTPKTSVEEYWGGDIPWFSVVDAPADSDVFVIDTEKHVTELGVENSSTKVLPKGTTIISARGTVGKCAVVGVPMAMNQSCYGIKGKNGIADHFTYFTIRHQVADLQRSGHGSVFNTITRSTFDTITIAAPPCATTVAFDAAVEASLERILANLRESRTLAALRDALLPKLLAGELRVPDAERFAQRTLDGDCEAMI
jgi:type I restriction enzyme, S subunit